MIEIRCPDCGKLLLKADAHGVLKPYCRHCLMVKTIRLADVLKQAQTIQLTGVAE